MELIIPKLGEFIPAVIAFILLWIVLAKKAWPIFTNAMDKREAKIKGDLADAEEAKLEGERLIEKNKELLDEAKAQAAQIIADAKKAGDAVKADITAQAQQEADAMISKARDAIEAEKKQAIAELQSSAADLSVSVAGRIIGENLSDEEHLKIVERYIAEAGSIDAN